MKIIAIYYLILVMMSNHISTYQHQAFIRKQQGIEMSNNIECEILNEAVFVSSKYEAEDLWAMDLFPYEGVTINNSQPEERKIDKREQVKEESMTKVEEKIGDSSRREQEETVDKQVEKERAKRDKQVENRDSLKQEDKESEYIQQEGKNKNESSGERKENKEEEINKKEEHKEDNDVNIKDNKEILAQDNSENSDGEKGESQKEDNEKKGYIGENSSEQTTASPYDFERKEPKTETNAYEPEKELKEMVQGQLQQNQVIEGDMHIEEGELDLNGKTLEICGNLYHNQGTLIIHNGKLVVHGSYFINDEIKKSGNNSSLVLEHDNDLIIVHGDIVSYGTDWFKKCTKGKIVLEGNFIGAPRASQMRYHTPLRSEWELVLAGQNNQKVDISSMWVKLPTIRIIGKKNREIELMMLKDDTIQKRKHHLNNIEAEVECQIELPESLIVENINAKAPITINGNCEAKQLNIFGNKVTINGNLKIENGISFIKGQVVVNGSLTLITACCIDMQYREDGLKIKDDFIMQSCQMLVLNEGELHIGGNIIQSNALREFITGDKVSVVFFNHSNGKQRLQGNLITLNCVKYSESRWEEVL